MVETYEIRLFSKYLSLVSDADRTSSRIAVSLRGVVGDPLFLRIGELDRRIRESKLGVAFGSWIIKRTYTGKELQRAQLFMLNVPMTHIAAEEFGTEYRDAADCEYDGHSLEYVSGTTFRTVPKKVPCGLCSQQVGPLKVPFGKFKRGLDIYRLWGGELTVSERFANLVRHGTFSGYALFPVYDVKKGLTSTLELSDCPAGRELLSIASAKGMTPTEWSFWCWLNEGEQKRLLERIFAEQNADVSRQHEGSGSSRNLAQLVLQSRPLEVSERSRFGANPFDTNSTGHHQCDSGVIAGLRPISSLSVLASSWDGADLCRTRVYVGARQGLFRPHQLFVVSKKFLKALQQHGMKGFQFEAVETV
jgi:hypothetical protein